MADLWQHDNPIPTYDPDGEVEIPRWIEQDITPADVAAIVQGGCDSGAYMPAVTYHQALATMAEHGDEVFGYLAAELGEGHFHPVQRPGVHTIDSWAGLACYYVSSAVELWASSAADQLGDILDALEEEERERDDA